MTNIDDADGYSGKLNSNSENYSYPELALRVYPEKAKQDKKPSWGTLIHPDECRRIMFLGNEPLMTTKGTQLENFQLKNWIDMTVESFGDMIQWDIYPKLRRHRPMVGEEERHDLDPAKYAVEAGEGIEDFAIWEDLYDYNQSKSGSNFMVKLRQNNVCRVHKWDLMFPYSGQRMLNLKERMVPKYSQGLLRAMFVRVPWSNLAPVQMGINAHRTMLSGTPDLPGAYAIDYTTGYEKAAYVPAEIKEQILKYFTICVMSSYGDGIIGGVANYSTSVGILHESLGTTMSATSAFFGARIKQLTDELNLWTKTFRAKYTGIKFGAL